MVTQATINQQYVDYEELDCFEKIGRRSEWGMPSRRAATVKRAMRRTSASKRTSHQISARTSGKHHRRRHKFV